MTDVEAGLAEACEHLPIFPLPRAVLLPGAQLPLHVFEPRYRALVDHARRAHGLFGLATLRPGYQSDYDGRPPVWPEVGIGRIVAYQALPDGRSNLLLRYVARGCIVQELDLEQPFRSVRVALLAEVPPPTAVTYERLRGLVAQIGRFSSDAEAEARRLMDLEGSDMLDALARKLLVDTDQQRAYLAENHIQRRADLVQSALADVLVAASVGGAEA